MTQNINLAIAFTGGFLTFFSPCFLPLVPAYLIYITGLSFAEVKKVRLMTIIHSLLFILGFTIVFTLLGMTASWIGEILYDFKDVLRVLGGLFVIFLGLYLMGIIKLSFLDVERRIAIAARPSGYLGTIFVGMVFALAWIPCVGPILAGILVYASQTETVPQGIAMLIAYAIGLGLPLFLVSLAVDYSFSFLKKIEKYSGLIHFVSGIFLVIIGLLLATNYLQGIITFLIDLTGYRGI